MPEFDISKIQTLLSLGLSKAGAELNRTGFDRLSHQIRQHPEINNPIISQRYIDERIYQQIKKNTVEGKPKVSLKREYLNELASYLNYDGFTLFEDQYSVIYDRIKQIPSQPEATTISLVFDHDQEDQIRERCTGLLHSGQVGSLQYQPINFLELDSNRLAEFAEEVGFTILLIDPGILDTYPKLFKILKDGMNKEDAVFSLWSSSETEYHEHHKTTINSLNWLNIGHLDLLVHCLLSRHPIPTKEETRQSQNEKPKVVNIRDSGTVNLGKIGKIKAEYISSRDMHININKDKSEGK